MKKLEVQILGSGTSMGVPVIGCQCRICHSGNPKDKRLRTSLLLKNATAQILIDTSADYRQQMLRAGVTYLDAVLYTHHHFDHIMGLDDLRSLNIFNKCPIPLYGQEETLKQIRETFKYAFDGSAPPASYPKLSLHPIQNGAFAIKGIHIIPIPLYHGPTRVLGFRIGHFAYCTDVNKIPESSYPLLQNLKVLILDALRFKPHPSHFSISEAIEEAQKIQAETTYFTHLSHHIMHEEVEAKLPEGIHLAYDGLTFLLDAAGLSGEYHHNR